MTSEGALLPSNKQKNYISDQEINDILASFGDDLMLKQSLNKNMHLEKLDVVLQKCGPANIFKFMEKCSNPEIKSLVLKRLRTLATMSVEDASVNAIDMFNMGAEGLNEEHVVDILSEAFGNLPTDILKKLLCDIIIPEMFNVNAHFGKKIHDVIIDVGFQLIEKFPITNLTNQEIKLYTTRVIDKYSKVLESLRGQNYSRWHDLWIFVVRFSAKHLHAAMDLANKLLRVVEYAFRNPSYEQRLKGYDCWKELIDNASLDVNHLCSNKQIKLLVTPLRAKFSKMEIVICKRFEVFLYLLEKLQRQSILCLNEFLEFCFGVSNNASNASKNGQGKLVPNLWLKSIQVFLAILGDQTHISSALNRTLFERQVIDANNISKFGYVTVCAVIECSIILKQISIESQEKISILSSLWEALFDIIVKSTTEIQEKCFQTIFDNLSTVFKEFNEEVTYIGLYAAFTQLLESSIDQRLISDCLKLLLEYSLKFLGETDVSYEFSQQFCELIQIACKEIHLIEFLLEQLKKLEPSRNESKLYTVWNILGTKLMENFNVTNHSKLVVQFFLWPVYHLQKFSTQANIDTCATWLKLFVTATQHSDSMKTTILDEYEKCLKSNPLLSSNVATLISIIANAKMEFSREFVNKILKLILSIMSFPLLPQEISEKMYDLILKCTNAVAVFSEDEVDSEIINNISECIEKIRSHQKNPHLVEVLENILNKKILHQSSNVEKRRKASLVTSLQDSSNGTPSANLKRSLRMTQMAFENTSVNANSKDKVNALQFFGKDIETLTPLKVKGSILQNQRSISPISRSRKIINSVKKPLVPEPPAIEDHTCDYVIIDTEVKLQRDKLTEHQIEELKRRRDDIPALYQDLSQSQTQSLSSSSKEVPSNLPEVEHNMSEEDISCSEHLKNKSSTINIIECQAMNKNCVNEISEIKVPSGGNFASVTKHEEFDSNTDNDADIVNKKSNRKSIGKIQKELQKIHMNIVGGDTFLKNLPSKRPRKVSTNVTPKRPRKAEQESKVDVKQTDNQISDYETVKHMNKKSDELTCKEFQDQIANITTVPKIDPLSNVNKTTDGSPEKGSDGSSEKSFDGNTDSDSHSNNRKNKFIKPKKHIPTPKSNKKKLETPKSTKKLKCEVIKTKKINSDKTKGGTGISTEPNVSEEPQSEIMFESEIDTERNKQPSKMGHVETPNKSEMGCLSTQNNRQNDSLLQSANVSTKQKNETEDKKNTIQKINIEKYKKLPKEIMKRNKEKVRKIQSQLKLAKLTDLTDSSEPKKTKGAKLIIREITKSKHGEDTKVTPATLKRNKDKKSSNIAYSIEPPLASVDLVSLDLGTVQSSSKESSLAKKVSFTAEIEKSSRKRKRTNSVNSVSSSSSAGENSPMEKERNFIKKAKSKKKIVQENSVQDITGIKPLESPTIQHSELNSNKSSLLKVKSKSSELSKSVEIKSISATKKTSPPKRPLVTALSPDSPSRVTRSRALSLSPLEPNVGSAKQNNSRKEPTKAVKILFTESEDIIESSQDSLLENTTAPIGNLSRNRNKQSPKTHISLKGELIEDLKHKDADIAEAVMVKTDGNNASSVDQKIGSEVISQADTLTCDSSVEPQPTVINVDLPEKPELTDSEKIISTADTVSIISQTSEDREEEINTLGLDVSGNNEIVVIENIEKIDTSDNSTKIIEANSKEQNPEVEFGTPKTVHSRNIPGSPVNNATPTLIKELLDNTLDISPISLPVLSEEEKKREYDIIQDLEKAIEQIEDPPEGSRALSPLNDDKSVKSQLSLNLRSNKLLNMVNVASPVSRSKATKKITLSPAPVNSRYEKLFSFFTGSKEDENKIDKKKDDLITCTENVENILTFSREVPSPFALPTSGILKRKLADIDERFSPCAKRKRVNFSYPCISSTKLYIRHKEEINTHSRPSFSQNLFGDDYEDEDCAGEDPFANPNTEPIGSEESMDITNSLLLCRKKPIYEQLVTCQVSIDQLWKRLSSPTYSELLKRILVSKNITTIGDLASLNEMQINRLPFKQPRIKTVRKALNFYFTNVYKKAGKDQEADVQNRASSSADSENENRECGNVEGILENVAEKTSETKRADQLADLRDRFSNILMKIKDEKIPLEEFGAPLLDLVDETEIIDLLKSVYNTDFRKFFHKSHWRYLMETIVQSGGTTEMFDIISDLADNNETFAGQLESIVQLRIEQNPLKDIISRRSLTDLKVAFDDCISRDVFKREEFLQTCFIPLIKSPSDIKTYFNHLTIVQVHELFIERVQPSDLSLFLEQIREHYGNYTIAECANKADVLKICSKEELMTSLIEKENEVQSVIALIGKISDQDKLLTLYDFIGTLITPEARRAKFIDFLNSIPLSSKSVESKMN